MKTQREKMKLFLGILAAMLIVCSGVLVYLHRRVIRAVVKGEPLPACPHWLPKALKEKCGV